MSKRKQGKKLKGIFPILEYDSTRKVIIDPQKLIKKIDVSNI